MKFPVFSLYNRETWYRDEFARDCLLQGRVCEPSVPESPRFGAGSPGGLGGLSRLTPRFTLGEQLLGAPALEQRPSRKRVWGNFSTGGSRGIRESNQYVREGGAAARDMLIRAAAAGWGVPPAECSAANSVITHTPSGRTATYGKVAQAAATLDPPKDIKLKDPKDWKIAGKPVKRLDTADKVNGSWRRCWSW
jgi:hypothetical protein